MEVLMIKYLLLYEPENIPLKNQDDKLIASMSSTLKIALWDSYDEAETAKNNTELHPYNISDLKVIAGDV